MTAMASSGGSPFYIPSYLDDSDGNADFKHLADTFSPSGPLRFRDAVDGHVVSKADMRWVLRFKATGVVTIPVDAELPNERIPDGAEIAVVNLSDGRVVIQPEAGVLVGGDERLVVNPWKVGVLVKNGANFWLLSLGNGTGGDSKNVPLPPENVKAFGAPASVVVSWDAPKDDGGSAITSYIVQQKKGTDFVDVKTTQDRYVQVDGLEVGTSYSFRVKAVNAVGFSEPSAEVSATPTKEFNDATGGTITQYEKDGKFFRVHTFLTNGTFTVTKATSPFRILAVASGTGGQPSDSGYNGYGGNGGGVNDGFRTLAESAYPVQVGPATGLATIGTDSYLGDFVARANAGAAGGYCPGDPSQGAIGGNGGVGPTSDITGTVQYYGSGGGGGGGIDSPQSSNGPGTYGIGGHGGSWSDRPTRGSGGTQGIVVVSYEIAPFNEAFGGNEKIVENYNGTGQKWKTHTFAATGTLTIKSGDRPFRVMVVGGGQGGGAKGGNGGAGGKILEQDFTLASTAHTVTVAGPAGDSSVGGLSSASGVVYGAGGAGDGDVYRAEIPPGQGCPPHPPGGDGYKTTIRGVEEYFGGGGGGGGGARDYWQQTACNGHEGGPGGKGGGGQGGHGTDFLNTGIYGSNGAPGAANTGGGGGGAGGWGDRNDNYTYSPGPGGSGLVVVAYQIG